MTQSNFNRVIEPFELQAKLQGDAVALVCKGREITYSELDCRAKKVAVHLNRLGIGPCQLVGVCLDRSIDMIVALLGILKSGAAYVPVDPQWPQARMQQVLSSSDLKTVALITDSSRARIAYDLQSSVTALKDVLLIDVSTQNPALEPINQDSVSTFWDHISEASVDRVSAAGFIRSKEEKAFCENEIDQYRDWVLACLQPWVSQNSRVLELGCGSGLIGQLLAPKVHQYLGIDPSEATLSNTRKLFHSQGISGAQFQVGFGHELSKLERNSRDVIVLASVIQFFPGPRYLEFVLTSALDLLAPGGTLLLADLIPSQHRAGQELHVDESWLHDFASQHQEIAEVIVYRRNDDFQNELRNRYDVVLRKTLSDSQPQFSPSLCNIQKRTTTFWHVEQHNAQESLPQFKNREDPAYVIYTSGSTGKPKGVVIHQASVLNVIDWVNHEFAINAADRILFVASICFDLSVYDIFGVLAAGGSLYIAQDDELRDPKQLASILASGTITLWDSAPAMLQQLVPFFSKAAIPGSTAEKLRVVLLSGDWIPVTLPDRIRVSFPKTRVISLGGATEATVWSNYYPVETVDPKWISIPYGRPIQNCEYFVLNSNLEHCPTNVPGDLYIGGQCLAAGYLDDPELTAKKFIPNPFQKGTRLYKTGDLARYWADGNLEFLGRADFQVKINGFRIELGEIESQLLARKEIREAVAAVKEDVPGDKRIIAYYVPQTGAVAQESQILAWLSEQLPSYMVPSALIPLQAIPLTRNGKIARDQLPSAPQREGTRIKAIANSPLEQTLTEIWEELLNVKNIGLQDNFFALGGHSMVLANLIFRIESKLNTKLTFREAYLNPTISQLSKLISSRSLPGDESPQQSALSLKPFPLSVSQQQIWFQEQSDPGQPTYNVPLGIQIEGALDLLAFTEALDSLIHRHPILRSKMVTTDQGTQMAPTMDSQDQSAFGCPLIDLSFWPKERQELELMFLQSDSVRC